MLTTYLWDLQEISCQPLSLPIFFHRQREHLMRQRPYRFASNGQGFLPNIYLSLSNTFIAKFLTLKDTEESPSPPASLTQTAFQYEPILPRNQF